MLPRRRTLFGLLAAVAVAAVSAVPHESSSNPKGRLLGLFEQLLSVIPQSTVEKVLESNDLWQTSATKPLLQVPLACLPKDYMTQETSLTLDHITKLAGSPECAEDASTGAKQLSRLHRRLHEIQQKPLGCDYKALAATEAFNTGFGGTMHGLVKPLMMSFARGLTMLTPAMPGWTGASCGFSMSCFFQPLAPSCEGTDPLKVEEQHEKLLGGGAVPNLNIKVWGAAFSGEDEESDVHFGPELARLQQESPWTFNFVNQNMSHQWHGDNVMHKDFRPMGWFRYMTHLQGYIWRPSQRMQAMLNDTMRQTGLTDALKAGPVIGMHVRHGDACGESIRGRSCEPLAAYMKYADQLRAQTGINTIYLATDSEDVLKDTENFPDYNFLTWRAAHALPKKLKRVMGITTLWWDVVYQRNAEERHENNNREVAEHAILEMTMLSKASLFIGKSTSNFYRTALELKAAGCDCMPAFYSLDSPWCFDFAIKAGVNVDEEGTRVSNQWLC